MSDWKKDLRDRFEDFREQEPEGLWSAIEAEIAPKKKALPLWWLAAVPAAAAVAALFLLPGRGVLAPAPSSSEKIVAVVQDAPSEEVLPPVSENMVPSLSDQLETFDKKHVVAAAPPASERVRPAGLVPQEVSGTEMSAESAGGPVSEPARESVSEPAGEPAGEPSGEPSGEPAGEPAASDPLVSERQEQEAPSTGQPSMKQENAPFAVPPRRSSDRSGRFSFSVSGSSGSAAGVTSQGYGSGPAMKRSAAAPGASFHSIARLLTSNQPTTTSADHRQPVRIGLTVSYALTPVFSLETGLFHTTLSSTLVSGTETVYTKTDQRLACVGIPLHLRCRITPPERVLSLYGVAGGSWEKGYALQRDNIVFLSGAARDRNREETRPAFSQWTAGAAVGLQLRPGKVPFALFAEPGIAYRFPNHSEIRTVYSDKPLSPSLTVGARFLIGSR